MLILAQTTPEEARGFARQVFLENRAEKYSFEKAAQIAVNATYDEFRLDDGSPLFALLRIFRFSQRAELHPELEALATAKSEYWLALMGSMGVEPAWCDRHTSAGHRAIPADSPATPMLKAAFRQIGLLFGADTAETLQTYLQDSTVRTRYFHVPEAKGSPFVPDQEGFVVPYAIQSVVGIGSSLGGNTSYMCIGFSLVPISQTEAEAFAGMNKFIGTLLSFHGTQAIWEPS